MTSILSEIGNDTFVSKTFKAGATIGFGEPVMISAAGVVIKATGTNSIGWAVPLDEIATENSADQYVADDLVLVKLKGEVLHGRAGSGGVAVGNFIKNAADGEYVAEATPTTKTVATEGIALSAAAENADFQFVRLG